MLLRVRATLVSCDLAHRTHKIYDAMYIGLCGTHGDA